MSTKASKTRPTKSASKTSSKSAKSALKSAVKSSVRPSKKAHKHEGVNCTECNKEIAALEQALFVEEEVGRFFCAEACIVAHFTSDIEKLEREYGRNVSANDLTSEERERYAHLRWLTLEEPEEIWREKTAKGDYRYTLVTEFKPDGKPVFAVAICLMLGGEPSFLYLAFISNDRYLVDTFRKGDKMKVIKNPEPKGQTEDDAAPIAVQSTSDRLAEQWSESDSLQFSVVQNRKDDDIPVEDYGFYQNCLEETLQEPSELWSYLPKAAKRVYYFIRHYSHDQDYWYIVMAKDTADETQIEIIDAFPTKDESLVQICRHGRQEPLGGKSGGANEETGLEVLPEKVRRNVH